MSVCCSDPAMTQRVLQHAIHDICMLYTICYMLSYVCMYACIMPLRLNVYHINRLLQYPQAALADGEQTNMLQASLCRVSQETLQEWKAC